MGIARPIARHSGFTLVEVMVALAILAIGLLAGIALLVDGLRASRGALLQTSASLLAVDIVDRIRINRIAGAAYALSEQSAVSPPSKTCAAIAECSATDVAQLDLYAWQQAVLASLPKASTSIDVEPVAGTAACLFTIVIRWAHANDAARSALVLTVQT